MKHIKPEDLKPKFKVEARLTDSTASTDPLETENEYRTTCYEKCQDTWGYDCNTDLTECYCGNTDVTRCNCDETVGCALSEAVCPEKSRVDCDQPVTYRICTESQGDYVCPSVDPNYCESYEYCQGESNGCVESMDGNCGGESDICMSGSNGEESCAAALCG